MSCAETANQATKCLRGFTGHIQHTLDGHILDGPPSDVANDFQLLANVKKQKAPSQMLREF